MYSVSEDYLAAMKEPVQRFGLEGRIDNVQFTEENILTGSFQITNQNTDDSQIMVGSTYVGQLSATFIGLNIPRYQWIGKTITCYLIRYVGEAYGNQETVPLGSYVVGEAYRTAEGISVTAYDYMNKFDKNVEFDTTSGKPYGFLSYMCTHCQVSLGMTQQEIEALPNGRKVMTFPTDAGLGTYRDVLSSIAAAMACYATIDRNGALVLRTFGNDVVDTIDPEHRWTGGSYEDYRTKITGVKLSYTADETVIYKYRTPNDGLTLDLGANVFLQFKNKHTAEDAVEAILYGLQYVEYVPYNVQMIGDPAYDLGDCFRLIEGLADTAGYFCLNKYVWTYNGSYDATGVGQDPEANAESKTDKALAALGASNASNKIEFYKYTNLQKYNINSNDTNIIDIEFTAIKDTIAIFEAEVLLDVTTSSTAIGTIKYIMNELEITDYHPIETWIDGKHILHLLYYINATALELTHWVVKLNITGGTAVIGIAQIQASISGQGLMKANAWDGRIYAEDVMGDNTLNIEPELAAYGDDASLALSEIIRIDIDESMGMADVGTEPNTVAGYHDTVYLNKKAVSALTWQEVYDLQGGWEELYEDYLW